MSVIGSRELVVPLAMLREICDRYLGYLKTTFYFCDPELRQLFERELDQCSLVNGPFLECMPVYERRVAVESLLCEILGSQLDPGFASALGGKRLLYAHQETAIRRLAAGRNVVVATGTGSGRTEAFLVPILAALYRESLGRPRASGVRALVLYPMNALANDQRRRLGEIAQCLQDNGSAFSFTFGRYTGETPEDERDVHRKASQHLHDRKVGELVFRREMRETPPDILLTNYSMLEYLLLRPDDSPLFDDGRGATWRFIVLDEAHQYRGTKGIEMAMLLRRLRQRLHAGGLNTNLQYVATSASLGGGRHDRANLAAFAHALFDTDFQPDDIVLETVAPITEGQVLLACEDYRRMASAVKLDHESAKRVLHDVAQAHGLMLGERIAGAELLYELLAHDQRVARLRHVLEEPRHVDEVKRMVFEDVATQDRDEALANFLALIISARDWESKAPLVGLRYHLFVRALEGAYVQYWPTTRVSLARLGQSMEPGPTDASAVAFEVALCHECGQHYYVGRVEGGHLNLNIAKTRRSS